MKLFSSLVIVSLLSFSFGAHADPQKLDLSLQTLLKPQSSAKAMLSKNLALSTAPQWTFLGKSFGSVERLQVLVKSRDPQLTKESIETVGGSVSTIAGKILVAQVPLSYLSTLSEQPEVLFVEASKRMKGKMDTARAPTNVDDVQAGLGGGIGALTGRDVIVGVVDSSLDYGNADFLGDDGETRVQYVKQSSGSSFLLCTQDLIESDDCAIDDGGSEEHGTHVTGIAAGSDDTYTGVAPDADIFFVFNSITEALPDVSGDTDDVGTFSGAVLDGVADIFAGADLLDKAAVVNLSMGTSVGAHDDSSLLEQGLNALLEDADGNQLPGRAIVDAAGNEAVNDNVTPGVGGIHAEVNASGLADPSAYRFIVLNDDDGANDIEAFGGAIVDMWFNAGDDCTVEARAYQGASSSQASDTEALVGPLAIDEDNLSGDEEGNGTVLLQLFTDASDANNSRPHAQLYLTEAANTSWNEIESDGTDGYVFDVIVRANTGTCQGDMWLYPDQTSIVDFLALDGNPVDGAVGVGYTLSPGDSNKTTTIPGTASGVITVGSYMQAKSDPDCPGDSVWQDIDGACHDQTDVAQDGTGGTVDQVSLFSSLGPTGEISGSRVKPDVVAPGEPIISTRATDVSIPDSLETDAGHFKLEGTSMASPYVAGVVALIFERNNTLTASEVKALLKSTARNLEGQDENAQGSGLVDAQAAIEATSADTSAYAGTRNTTSDDLGDEGFSNHDIPGRGGAASAGCSLVPAFSVVRGAASR